MNKLLRRVLAARHIKKCLLVLILMLPVSMPVMAEQPAMHYAITVAIDPASRQLQGRSIITVAQGGHFELMLIRRFKVTALRAAGFRIAQEAVHQRGLQVWQLTAGKNGPFRIEIDWQGELAVLDTSLDHAQTLGRPIPVTGAEGTFLPNAAIWYPQIAGALASYQVDLTLPYGQRGLVAGRLLNESESELEGYQARFVFQQPAEGIALMAGPYTISSATLQSAASNKTLSLRTYFHPSIAELADDYLESVKHYIHLYERWIGEYPYSEFSVVSSPTPTGFGMPTLTYLGVSVLRLPFIRMTSLGHEVLHNWWGNGVYPDYASGNWSEGLTTFMADYAYKEQESDEAARDMRLDWLRDFNLLAPSQDQPLLAFTSRTHAASKIVGYNKAAMLFFMLRDLLGEATFDRAIRALWQQQRFRVTAWQDIQRVFETVSGRSLDHFFSQWLTRTGAPALQISQATYSRSEQRLSLMLKQAAPVYDLRVPILVRSQSGAEETLFLDLDVESQSYQRVLSELPKEVVLDPDFRVFRQLAADETVPILREVMVNQTTRTLLLFPGQAAAYRVAYELAARMQGREPEIERSPIAMDDERPVLVVGLGPQVDDWLVQQDLPAMPAEIRQESASAHAWTVRRPNGATLAMVAVKDEASLSKLGRALPHYGRQSYVVFSGPAVIDRGVWPMRPQVLPVQFLP
ncbi:MAG TPA: M1 family aminopeptidase [Nitrosomonas halophila]|nr:M1 family aminopeptidase [Nitrosomonas halophila]